MEVFRKSEVSKNKLEQLKREGCLIEPFTISGETVEECLYIVHPVRSKGGKRDK